MTSGEGNGSSVAESGGSPPAAAKSDWPRGLGAREVGWLLEGDMPDGTPGWMTLKPTEALWGVVLTKNSSEALRFARRADAEDYYARHIDDGPLRITEHSWG